jgi:hypothetical protein
MEDPKEQIQNESDMSKTELTVRQYLRDLSIDDMDEVILKISETMVNGELSWKSRLDAAVEKNLLEYARVLKHNYIVEVNDRKQEFLEKAAAKIMADTGFESRVEAIASPLNVEQLEEEIQKRNIASTDESLTYEERFRIAAEGEFLKIAKLKKIRINIVEDKLSELFGKPTTMEDFDVEAEFEEHVVHADCSYCGKSGLTYAFSPYTKNPPQFCDDTCNDKWVAINKKSLISAECFSCNKLYYMTPEEFNPNIMHIHGQSCGYIYKLKLRAAMKIVGESVISKCWGCRKDMCMKKRPKNDDFSCPLCSNVCQFEFVFNRVTFPTSRDPIKYYND